MYPRLTQEVILSYQVPHPSSPVQPSPQLRDFFNRLWQQYRAITPQAEAIHQLFSDHNETVINDHVAFRTFADSPISLSALEPQLFDLGFFVFDEYHFKQKKLYARSYNHPQTDTKIFLSELLWQQLPADSIKIIEAIIQQIPASYETGLSNGRLWKKPTYDNYLTLLNDSEYAAWLSIWGLRANHFTVYINALTRFSHLRDVVELLQRYQYSLNNAGGVIKGNEDIGLIQASTHADKIEVLFDNAESHQVPSCYYEFAQRFAVNGELYQGFVSASADKIFESTDNIK